MTPENNGFRSIRMVNDYTKTVVSQESAQHPDESALRAGADNLINGCVGDV